MDLTLAILRIIHIFSGVFWAGGSFFILSFVQPTANATGEEGQRFVQHMTTRTRFGTAMAGVAILTTLSGLWMYWRIFGFQLGAFATGYGVMLSIGALAGIGGLISGLVLQGLPLQRVIAIGKEIAAAGGPPAHEKLAEIQGLVARIQRGAQLTATLLAIALLFMAAAEAARF